MTVNENEPMTMVKQDFKHKLYKAMKVTALCVLAFAALVLLAYGVLFAFLDRGDMKVNYWKADQLYYESIGLFFFDLENIILGITLLAAALWKLGSLLIPNRTRKLLKPISRRSFTIMTLSFGALLTAFIMLIARQRQLILTHDFSRDEAPWSAYLYFHMGMYEIGALLSLEGLVFSASGLWRRVKAQRQTGEEKRNREDKL